MLSWLWSCFFFGGGGDFALEGNKWPVCILARACGVPAVGVRAVDCWQWRSGHYFHPSFLFFFPFFFFFSFFFPFFFFFSVATFSHRRSARIKKIILRKLLRTPKNLGIDPVDHFGAPGGHFGFCRWWTSAPFAARLVLLYKKVWTPIWRTKMLNKILGDQKLFN